MSYRFGTFMYIPHEKSDVRSLTVSRRGAIAAGSVVALVGLLPRLTLVAWAWVGVTFVVGWLGGLLDLPGWVNGISPFEHLPLVPVEDLAWLPLGALTALAVALLAVGLVGFRLRQSEHLMTYLMLWVIAVLPLTPAGLPSAEALADGVLAGCALDVVSQEPVGADNPLLWAPKCLLTPHMAWAAVEATDAGARG